MTRSRSVLTAGLCVIATALAVLPASAVAATPEFLWQTPEDGEKGLGPGG